MNNGSQIIWPIGPNCPFLQSLKFGLLARAKPIASAMGAGKLHGPNCHGNAHKYGHKHPWVCKLCSSLYHIYYINLLIH